MALSPRGTKIPVWAEAHQAWLPQLLDHDDVRLARVPWQLLSAATPYIEGVPKLGPQNE